MLKLRLKEYSALFLLTTTSFLWAGQCSIEILNEKFSGEKIRLNFTSKLKSKSECQKLAQMHRPNFNPTQVKFKRVDFSWRGKDLKTHQLARLKKNKNLRLSRIKKNKNKRSNQF